MVDIAAIDPERAAQIMGRKPEPEVDPWADLIPQYARVQIPLESKGCLDEAADILIALGHSLRLLARNASEKQTRTLYLAHGEIKAANQKMQERTITGRSK